MTTELFADQEERRICLKYMHGFEHNFAVMQTSSNSKYIHTQTTEIQGSITRYESTVQWLSQPLLPEQVIQKAFCYLVQTVQARPDMNDMS